MEVHESFVFFFNWTLTVYLRNEIKIWTKDQFGNWLADIRQVVNYVSVIFLRYILLDIGR